MAIVNWVFEMMELRMRRSTLLSFFAVLLLALAVGVQSRCTLDDPDSVVQALKFRAPEPPRRSLLRSVWRRLGGQYSCEVQGLLGQHIALSMVPEAIASKLWARLRRLGCHSVQRGRQGREAGKGDEG